MGFCVCLIQLSWYVRGTATRKPFLLWRIGFHLTDRKFSIMRNFIFQCNLITNYLWSHQTFMFWKAFLFRTSWNELLKVFTKSFSLVVALNVEWKVKNFMKRSIKIISKLLKDSDILSGSPPTNQPTHFFFFETLFFQFNNAFQKKPFHVLQSD